jgi:NAD(P)-dependent dehydrogenase (short-subunit alcohol dehydrogenase family)
MMDGLRTFDGAVAIVTGAASGIGKAIAETLAARGSAVVLTDIDQADAEAAARQIRERGGRASAHHLDVTDAREFDEVMSETVGRLGRLDYVFNNAGIGVAGEVGEHTLEAWDRILDVNLKGVIHGIQFAYPVMLRQGFGHIVNTASMAGLATLPGSGSYTATKHAVVALSKVLRAEAWSRGIRVSVLCPGVIRTPILEGGRHGIFLASEFAGGAAEGRPRVLRAAPPDARRDVRAEGARSDRAQPGDHHRARVVAGLLVDGAGRAVAVGVPGSQGLRARPRASSRRRRVARLGRKSATAANAHPSMIRG